MTSQTQSNKYPGLKGPEFESAFNAGYIDLGLLNPEMLKLMSPNDVFLKKMREAVLRNVVRLILKRKGKVSYIRDPEWTLKSLFNENIQLPKLIRGALAEALEAMFDVPMKVILTGKKGKTGFGWSIKVPELEDVLAKY